MVPFIFVAVLLSIPVFLKAYLLPTYEIACDVQISQMWGRLLLPAFLAVFGYLIFVLEGVQSSVILANKQTPETFNEALESIDISKGARARASRALGGIIDGAKIDDFLIGRQLLIIAFAFLFKFWYDRASLTPNEINAVRQASCAWLPNSILSTYSFLDHWLFSTLLCAVLVAYIFQVPSKLMAQYHPMRFLTTIALAIYSPKISKRIGRGSLLWFPLDALRRRGIARGRQGRFSYFSDQKELSPVSTQQVFDALANLYGEYVSEVTITLGPESSESQNVWYIKDQSTYKIVKPNRVFSHTIQVPEMRALKYKVLPLDADGKPSSLENDRRYNDRQYLIAPIGDSDEPSEVLARLYARFDSDRPAGSFVSWQLNYLTPEQIMQEQQTPFGSKVFGIQIKKPVEKVVFSVIDIPCEEPKVKVCPVDGAESPTCGRIEKGRSGNAKSVTVHYPSIGSRLEFYF